jgi:hypothetical protein
MAGLNRQQFLVLVSFVWSSWLFFDTLREPVTLRWSQNHGVLVPCARWNTRSRRSSERRPNAGAQNEVPSADANGAPASERLQAVGCGRRSPLCRTDFRSA